VYTVTAKKEGEQPGGFPKPRYTLPHCCCICISSEEVTLQSHSFAIAKLFGDELSVKDFQHKKSRFIALFPPRLKRLVWPDTKKTQIKLVYLVRDNSWGQVHSLYFIHHVTKYLI